MCGVLMLGTSDLQVEQDAQIQVRLRHKLRRLTCGEATSVPLKYLRPMRRELMQTEIHTTRPTVQYNRMTDIHPPTNYSYKKYPLRRVCGGEGERGRANGRLYPGKDITRERNNDDRQHDRPTDRCQCPCRDTGEAPELSDSRLKKAQSAEGSRNKRLTPSRC